MGEPDAEDPLELEHMMGFNGECKGSVQFHPVERTKMISYTGCLLVVSDVDDPHQQEFLRGHNEAITCLAISPTGNLIASGQASTTRVPNSEATVIVWDYKTRQPIYRLMELHDGIQFSRNKVQQLAFSPDEAFLAGSDDQPGGSKLCIWHTATAQLATIHKTGFKDLAFLAWGEITKSTRKIQKNPSYELLAAARDKVQTYKLEFDVYTMQYKIGATVMQLPSSGLARSYNCAHTLLPAAEGDASFLVAGSSAGELCVFNITKQVFRAAVPVGQGGLLSLAVCDDPMVTSEGPPMAWCGCGDGTLKLLQGRDLQWVCLCSTMLEGQIQSLTLSADSKELLAGTSYGNIYHLDAKSLVPLTKSKTGALLASHAKPISCMAFGSSSEWFVTGSESGSMRRWELSQYMYDFEIAPPAKTCDATNVVHAVCCVVRQGAVLSGWNDGAIRAFDDETGQLVWQISGAHRGTVTCVDQTPNYLITAGADGSVRVWDPGPSKSLLGNFDEHTGRITSLCVDLANSAHVHTCGQDKLIVTIDLAQARRVGCHSTKEGHLTAMVQSTTHELELISGDSAGNLKWWDCDEVDPVSMLVSWSPMDDVNKERRLTHVDLSPPLAEGSVGSDYLLACTASGDLQIWDLEQSQLISVGAAHSEEITQASWSPDGKQIVSVGKDACICVWNFYGAAKPQGAVRPPQR